MDIGGKRKQNKAVVHMHLLRGTKELKVYMCACIACQVAAVRPRWPAHKPQGSKQHGLISPICPCFQHVKYETII